ncbi:hypothetical protein Tco_0067617 [Tanacetum coccineum]
MLILSWTHDYYDGDMKQLVMVLLGLLKDVQKKRSQSSSASNNDNVKSNDGPLVKEENNGDTSSGFKQQLVKKLNSLKLVIMSASLDARGFSEYFSGAKAVHVQGRQFPVDILYTTQSVIV